jgi:uncharacterized protein YraI
LAINKSWAKDVKVRRSFTMNRIARTMTRSFALAGVGLLAAAGIASAAVVRNDLNLRSGPGTGYRVIDVMPAGAYARVLGCGGSWCRVAYGGQIGYASASYLGGRAYAAAPPPVYVAPPVVSFGFGYGRPYWGHHRYWGHRHWGHRHWRHHHRRWH